jgi:hypothetical protein
MAQENKRKIEILEFQMTEKISSDEASHLREMLKLVPQREEF